MISSGPMRCPSMGRAVGMEKEAPTRVVTSATSNCYLNRCCLRMLDMNLIAYKFIKVSRLWPNHLLMATLFLSHSQVFS